MRKFQATYDYDPQTDTLQITHEYGDGTLFSESYTGSAAEAIVIELREHSDSYTPTDKNNRRLFLRDFEAKNIVGIQIGQTGHKLWVCIDGIAVLRVKSPRIELEDSRNNV